MKWEKLPFAKVFSDVTGGNVKLPTSAYQTHGLTPIIDQGAEFIAGYTNQEDCGVKRERPVIIFGDHTRILKYVDFDFCLGADGVKVLQPIVDCSEKYLFYFLQTVRLPNLGYNRHFKFLKEVEIPLPPLPIQKQIADTLDKADALRRKDLELMQKYDELAQSIFYDMFGDPVRNEHQWDVKTFGDVCKSFKYGTNVKSYDIVEPGAVPVIRIPNVLNNTVVFDNLKYSQLTEKEFSDVRLHKGDLLFVRTNGNPDYIGRCAVFNSDKKAAYASYLIRARIEKKSNVIPQFLQSLISSKMYRREVVKRATTTAGNYNINTESLKSLKLIIPPVKLQIRFLSAYEAVSKLQETAISNCSRSVELFENQLTRFFNN
jgi:type I restriction enzyme, S subunit